MTARLPVSPGDDNAWATVINAWLLTQHNNDGTHKPVTPTTVGFFNGLDYGAKGDALELTDAVISAGSSTVTSATAPFTSTAVDGGKLVRIQGAGSLITPLLPGVHAPAQTGVQSISNPSGTTATVFMPNQLVVGMKVTLASFTPSGYNNTFTVTGVTPACPDATNNTAFTITLGGTLGTPSIYGTIQWALPLVTTISTVTNSTTAVLANTATTATAGSVMYFGSDNATAINALLTAAGSNVALLPQGAYMAGSQIAIHDSNHLAGVGMFITTIIAHSSAFTLIGMFGSNWTVRDIGLRGTGFRDTTFAKIFDGGNKVNCTIERCLIEQSAGQGISFATGSNHNNVRFCVIRNCGDEGLYASTLADYFFIIGNRFIANYKCCIDWGGKQNTITFNYFEASGAAQDFADNEAILINGTRLGSILQDASNNLIGFNEIVNPFECGIRLTTEASSPAGVCVDNLVIANAIRGGIFQTVDIRQNVKRTTLALNTITENHGLNAHGITMADTTDNMLILNEISNCDAWGILIYGPGGLGSKRNVLKMNTILNCGNNGIRLLDSAETDNVITDNTLIGNAGNQIQDDSGVGSGNIIARNDGWNTALLTASLTVGSTPWSPAIIARPSRIQIPNGTLTAVTVGGVAWGLTAAPLSLEVPANQQAIITYSVAPTGVTQLSM